MVGRTGFESRFRVIMGVKSGFKSRSRVFAVGRTGFKSNTKNRLGRFEPPGSRFDPPGRSGSGILGQPRRSGSELLGHLVDPARDYWVILKWPDLVILDPAQIRLRSGS